MNTVLKLTLLLTIIALSQSSVLKCFTSYEQDKIVTKLKSLESNEITISEFTTFYKNYVGKKNIKTMIKCLVENKPNDQSSLISKVGYTLLYSSKCAQEAGAEALILDNLVDSIKDFKKEWKNAIMTGIFAVLFGKQAYGDCSAAVQAIKNVWAQ